MQIAPVAEFQPKFPFGDVVITIGAREKIPSTEIPAFLRRHLSGDWGDLDEHDRQVNERALAEGGRLFSRYESRNGVRFYIITDPDRQHTTILLPSEY
jgi:hypothetical protein